MSEAFLRSPAVGLGPVVRGRGDVVRRVVLVLLLVPLLVLGLDTSGASFSGLTGSPGNRFAMAAVFPPGVPAGLAATAGDRQAALSWSAATGADDYEAQYRVQGGGGWTSATATVSTGQTVTGLTNGTTYEFQVRAGNSGGNSAWAPTSPVTATPVISTPTGLAATAGDTQASLSWNSVTGASNYRVQYRVQGGGGWTQIAWQAATSATVTGLTNGTTYEFQVQAQDASTSPWGPGSEPVRQSV